MAETPAERATAVQGVVEATKDEASVVKEAALRAVSADGATDTATTAERAAAVQQTVEATKDEPDSVKKAALEAIAPVPRPEGPVVGWLWKTLLVGLLILVGAALVGVLWAVLDGNQATDSDKALILFTTLVGGLLGLFVTSPTEKGTGSRS